MPTDAALQEFADAKWMAVALQEARAAGVAGEVPVGAVIVKDGVLVAAGSNSPIASNDPTAHAEVVALRQASQVLSSHRLNGCTLYVTLEPCAMCAGALLHSRVDRVVFGAHEPKTGAAGSILNLFAHAEINHQTSVHGGVLASECTSLLVDFFKQRRHEKKALANPLREDALRTADTCFDSLSIPQFASHYLSDTPTLDGWRLHYLDEGSKSGTEILLCVHSNSGWGVEFYRKINTWLAEGKRVIVPDLIGFGRSDKPKRQTAHSLDFHVSCLMELLKHLQIHEATLITSNSYLISKCDVAELMAPYPDKGHASAPAAFKSAGIDTSDIGSRSIQAINKI